MFSRAGFNDVWVQSASRSRRLPPPKEFLWQYVHSTTLAGVVAQVENERLSALERGVVAKWQEFMRDGHMALEVRVVIATARK